MRFDTVIFDLDGTLIDSGRGIVNATSEALDALGLEPMDESTIKSLIGPPIGDSISDLRDYPDELRTAFFAKFRELYKEKHLMEAELYPGIAELLRELRTLGCRLCIATNKREDYTATLLDGLGILGMFESVRAQDDANSRTKSSMIEGCLVDVGSHASSSVMIGDTAGDMRAAENAGTHFIGVTYGFGFRSGFDVTYGESASSCRELVALIRG